MDRKLLLLSTAIGLLCHERIVLTSIQTHDRCDLAKEKLFQETFSDGSISLEAESENDNELDDIATEAVGDTPFISPKNHVSFLLFTRSNPNDAYLLEIDNSDNLEQSPFNSARQTKVIIHGWMNRVTESWILNMREKYLITGNYNVIVVDWDLFSMNEYVVATHMTRLVGERTAEFLIFLNTAAKMSFRSVHILGHSLGAHVAGFAGEGVSGALGRISGMDPAGPLFEVPFLKKRKSRLDATDALFVDIIHTCSGAAGFSQPIGHVDFYPNGGSFTQPGCPLTVSLACSHGKAIEYMIDSTIYPNEFVAVQCNNWDDYKEGKCSGGSTAIMGEHAGSDSRGTFYLETNTESPFGKGKTT